ncbi:hypothetical protein JKA74_02285 [Marivirga sp. S37H4]|uniref:Uncharacterized protein n=1 Tax=Marivirga aurantiaca TaxID=2802615 RepID=A0A934WVT9_9BACT|nr:hypothetical protein [Marivirga aurantiaca]MBK6263851.1 hypothetical protein [Marivirga aurantiaca]
MDPLVVLGVQCTFSMLVFFLILKWYVVPKITKETRFDILAVLLLVNVFRYLPLSLFMPGQVSADFPPYLKEIVAHGDFLSGIIALIALILLKSKKKKSAIAFTWLFSVVSLIDIVVVLTLAMSEKVYLLPLGANYFTVSVYVPMLIVIQVLILKILLAKAYR